MTEHPNVTLSGFELIERIGRGGMGEVWRAERTGPGGVKRRAAVKRILSKYQSDPTLRERFIAEARTNSRLEHPNIVQVLDFGDAPELHLVLEFVEGAPVATLLQNAHTGVAELPITAACFIAAEAATALDYAHRRTDDTGRPLGIVHRDVSPQNILVSIDGAVKVNDFGIARAADNVIRTVAGVALGKQPYMAPEQILGEPIDRRADIFALGIVLWELLTCRPLLPRNAPDKIIEALTRCEFQPPSQLRPGVPPELDAIVAEALARSPEKRTQSAARMAQSLRIVLATLSPGYDGAELARLMRVLVPESESKGSGVRNTQEIPARAAPAPVAAHAPVGSHEVPDPSTAPPLSHAPNVTPATGAGAQGMQPEHARSRPIPPTVQWGGPPPGPSSLVPPPPSPSVAPTVGMVAPAPVTTTRPPASKAPMVLFALLVLCVVGLGGVCVLALGADDDAQPTSPNTPARTGGEPQNPCEHLMQCCNALKAVPNVEHTQSYCDAVQRLSIANAQQSCATALQALLNTEATHVRLPQACH